jgi:hypothetical protein
MQGFRLGGTGRGGSHDGRQGQGEDCGEGRRSY